MVSSKKVAVLGLPLSYRSKQRMPINRCLTGFVQTIEIPLTEVSGSFRFFLPQPAILNHIESHQRQLVDPSDLLGRAVELLNDLNDPPTAVGGIFQLMILVWCRE